MLKQKYKDYYLKTCDIEGDNAPPLGKPIKAISLFSGIGGIDIACELCNIETVAFCEMDRYCHRVLRSRWENVYVVNNNKKENEKTKILNGIPIFTDVRKLTKEAIENERGKSEKIELIHGGFPCQSYSNMGAGLGNEDPRALFGELCRLVDEFRPTWVLGENVGGFRSLGLDDLQLALEYLGYDTRTFLLPALAQNAVIPRYRVFIVGFNRDRRNKKSSKCVAGLYSQNGNKKREEQSNKRKSKKLLCAYAGGEGRTNVRVSCEAWSKLNLGRYNAQEIFEPRMGRVVDGDGSKATPRIKEKIHALGNAVNPIQIYPLVRYLKYIDYLLDAPKRPFMLPNEIKDEAKKIISKFDAKQKKELKDLILIEKVGDEKEKLYHANQRYKPYKIFIKTKCDFERCADCYHKITRKKQPFKCDMYDTAKGKQIRVEVYDIHNIWKTNQIFAKIVLREVLSLPADSPDEYYYYANAALVNEIWRQLLENDFFVNKQKTGERLLDLLDNSSRCPMIDIQ